MAQWYNVMGNIIREVAVDLSTTDFVDNDGFFLRAGVAGDIKYLPVGNADNEAVTKTVEASSAFGDPVICRKVFKVGTSATGIYAGYGI